MSSRDRRMEKREDETGKAGCIFKEISEIDKVMENQVEEAGYWTADLSSFLTIFCC